MDNILKVCDDKYCIEVYKNISNISNCSYSIYPSINDNNNTFEINNIWIIITLSILLLIIISFLIICIYCYCDLQTKISNLKKDKLSDRNETNTTIRHSDTISQKSEYQAIPGDIVTDNFTYFRFQKDMIAEVEAAEKIATEKKLTEKILRINSSNSDNINSKPTTKLTSKTSEEELLIDRAFNITLRDRQSNSCHDVNNKKDIPYKLTQIKHRGSIINIAVEQSSNSTTLLSDSQPLPTTPTNINNINNIKNDDEYNDPNDEYQCLPDSRKSTWRGYDRKYPEECELNRLESGHSRLDTEMHSFMADMGTQDDMIYKSNDDFDYKDFDENITIDDFSRFSTIRLIKFFAPQEIKYCDIDFKNEEFIGQGSVGKVFKAKYNGIHVAVKKLNNKYFNLSKNDLQNFKREASLMQKVGGHKHIARMYGFCTSPEICIVTEYYARKSIYDIIKNKATYTCNYILNMNRKLQMCYEASLGILHLHRQNVIHRDISARNLLVDENWTVVVSDLGMSRLKASKTNSKNSNLKISKKRSNFGPIKWMAPESITMHIYNEKTDVYSFGITLYEIFTELDPYPNLLPLEAGVKVVSKGLRPEINNNINNNILKSNIDLIQLMQTLWKHEPDQRPKFKYICESLKNIKDKLE